MQLNRREFVTGAATASSILTTGCIGNKKTHNDSSDSVTLSSKLTKRIVGIGERDERDPSATGWIYEPGLIITNAHVFIGGSEPFVWKPNDGWYEGEIVEIDAILDLAVVKVEDTEFNHTLTVSSKNPKLGEDVISMGYPSGLNNVLATGKITGKDKLTNGGGESIIPNCLQTSASQVEGSSGSPLVDTDLELQGTIVAGNKWTSFAISSKLAKPVLAKISKGEKYYHPHIGVEVATVKPNSPVNYGVRVLSTEPGTPANEILNSSSSSNEYEGDIILSLNGEKMLSKEKFLSVLFCEYRPGDTIKMSVMRDKNRPENISMQVEDINRNEFLEYYREL